MYPILVSGAVSLASKAMDMVAEHQAAKAAAAPAGTAKTSFASELATAGQTRLQEVNKALRANPQVQAALAGSPGATLAFPEGGGVAIQNGNGAPVPLKLDASTVPLVNEARQLLASLPGRPTTLA